MKIHRALISVSDKTNLIPFAKSLSSMGVEIISTGGTARALADADIPVIEISEITRFPEMLEGRVKTLHPFIHGGILAKRKDHVREIAEHKLPLIDLVVINLYPFQTTIADPNTTLDEAIEQIDIGGPALLRSAAKNYQDVIVVPSFKHYEPIAQELQKKGDLPFEMRRDLALEVFAMTNQYDFAIEQYLREKWKGEKIESIRLRNVKPLGRYAENHHQKGRVGTLQRERVFKQIRGKALGYNNYLDADAAWNTVLEFTQKPTAVIVKHGNPCGVASSDTLQEALERAWQSDSVSAFGSIIAFNETVDVPTLQVLCERENPQGKKGWFVEMLIAPSFTSEALNYLNTKPAKASLRLLLAEIPQSREEYRSIAGGILIQEKDRDLYSTESIKDLFRPSYLFEDKKVGIVTEKIPLNHDLFDFSFRVCKHIKSNAICITREWKTGCFQLLGMGAGQPNRRDSVVKLALTKARENLCQEGDEEYITSQLKGCVLASDAFFPFSDSIDAIASANICSIIQPGGSVNDDKVIEACNTHHIAMVFTGMRHFKH